MAILRVKDKNGNIIDIPAIRGYNAYQLALAHGFEGTEAEWLNSLEGPQGPPYELTEEDKSNIASRVEENLRPEQAAMDARVDVLEADAVDTETRLAILENAVANYSKLQVEKVASIEEITNPDIIYLLPSADGSYYYEYLLYNGVPEIIGNTDIDLTNYVTKDYLKNNVKHYRHNIVFWYRHSNGDLSSSGSNGNFQATLTIINNDPNPYKVNHNNASGVYSPATMSEENAWQLYRLYQALALSHGKTSYAVRPCSGASIIVSDDAASLTRGINSAIGTGYYDESTHDWKRYIQVDSSLVDGGSLGGRSIRIDCGHPTFVEDIETSIWTSKQQFLDNEYNLTDSFGKKYLTYFCQHKIRCSDTVETLDVVTVE